MLGRPLSDFFDCEIDSLTRFVAPNAIERNVVRLTASGRSLFIQVVPPATIRVLPAAAPSDEDCKLPAPLKAVAGEEPSIQKSLRKLSRLLNTNMSILVNGETGTGKEYLAKAIHQSSARAQGPFVPVNCAALPENLIESELFGYESGSFTGALAKGKKGLVREAHGGTLFLDEIGDMPLSSQTRLLRVLAEREVTPIGGSQPDRGRHAGDRGHAPRSAGARQAGTVPRGSLFPAQRRHHRAAAAARALRPRRGSSAQLLEKRPMPTARRAASRPRRSASLRPMHWPGNIRELVNVIDFACAVASDPEIGMDDLPDQVFRRPAR